MKPQKEGKIGRNAPCPCGSGQKYKYCCIGKDLQDRSISVWNGDGLNLFVDMTNDMMNMHASVERPLKNFCKDNELYYFGTALTLGDCEVLDGKLRAGTLTKDDVLADFRKNATKELMTRVLEMSMDELPMFKKREAALRDAFEAHFDGKYTLSIPTLFLLLEGILRENGNLRPKDKFRPTIPIDIWNNSLQFSVEDSAKDYNGFITRLFEGGGDPNSFNRNPILHGTNTNYHNENHSLLLILSIIEVRSFKFSEALAKKHDYSKKFVARKDGNSVKVTYTP
ncbi:MAG: SEC-C domain-containing protein [Bacteroidetes bacterium]|nr:SEC-C domain-containing protein [Bacteroidota bacterium]